MISRIYPIHGQLIVARESDFDLD